jgi:hypothetical protein
MWARRPLTPQSSTVVALHERENWMARRVLTVDRHEEIKRRLADGRSLREIFVVAVDGFNGLLECDWDE